MLNRLLRSHSELGPEVGPDRASSPVPGSLAGAHPCPPSTYPCGCAEPAEGGAETPPHSDCGCWGDFSGGQRTWRLRRAPPGVCPENGGAPGEKALAFSYLAQRSCLEGVKGAGNRTLLPPPPLASRSPVATRQVLFRKLATRGRAAPCRKRGEGGADPEERMLSGTPAALGGPPTTCQRELKCERQPKKGSRILTSISMISSDTPSPASSCEEGDARSSGYKSATRCFMPAAFRNGADLRMATRRTQGGATLPARPAWVSAL
ncbi:uncharacterized protein LOC123816971 [Phyllostomus hastatus]|uniref:uncharacterized protein LOC123816971 n=1 Tax=Phyllostomus hastatus TaxID=9423 RepID=UPI001E681C32|nr:uncharacterized protein LOC123816971 [Phyllostomus hastatus]